jgi:ATP-binding cassette subfamily B (MDR/TAP) protein 1
MKRSGENNDESTNPSEKAKPRASVIQTLSFVWDCGVRIRILFVVGVISGILSGVVFPAFAFLVSTMLSKLSAAAEEGLSNVREFAYIFMVIGVYALIASLVQSWCLEIVAGEASANFRLQWFKALLRQDAAFFGMFPVFRVQEYLKAPNLTSLLLSFWI